MLLVVSIYSTLKMLYWYNIKIIPPVIWYSEKISQKCYGAITLILFFSFRDKKKENKYILIDFIIIHNSKTSPHRYMIKIKTYI